MSQIIEYLNPPLLNFSLCEISKAPPAEGMNSLTIAL
jgi:hypothetical protein